MKTLTKISLVKKDISKEIRSVLGLSNTQVNKITDDFIEILKLCIFQDNTNIKNFGTFKCIQKKQRIGRNPKTKKKYIITARRSLSFYPSKKLNISINLD